MFSAFFMHLSSWNWMCVLMSYTKKEIKFSNNSNHASIFIKHESNDLDAARKQSSSNSFSSSLCDSVILCFSKRRSVP